MTRLPAASLVSRNNHHREVITVRGREIPCDVYKREGSEVSMQRYDRRPLWQRELINEYHEAHVDVAISRVGIDQQQVRNFLAREYGKPVVPRKKLRYRPVVPS